jgi:hypothetical protein
MCQRRLDDDDLDVQPLHLSQHDFKHVCLESKGHNPPHRRDFTTWPLAREPYFRACGGSGMCNSVTV